MFTGPGTLDLALPVQQPVKQVCVELAGGQVLRWVLALKPQPEHRVGLARPEHLERRRPPRSFAAGQPGQLRYEAGDAFDPDEPLKAGFLNHSEGYPGNNILLRSDGTLVICLAHANAPGDPENHSRPWRMGSICFLGRWDAVTKDYEWTAVARVDAGCWFGAWPEPGNTSAVPTTSFGHTTTVGPS